MKKKKKNVAIITGGDSSEFGVSLRSAENLYAYIDKNRYNVYLVFVTKEAWVVLTSDIDSPSPPSENSPENPDKPFQLIGEFQGTAINKNTFSFQKGYATVQIDFAYITIHGTPGEDGRLQGYFDMLGIPYSTCGVLTSALTFNKYVCNQFLKSRGITVADSILVQKGQPVDSEKIVKELGLPLFVKPNEGGSSFGITKVKDTSQIQAAVEKAFDESDEVIIERFISGIEVTCGCYRKRNKLIVLPLTEVVPENEFFDYGAKYNGEVQEITPARISTKLTGRIQRETKKIYDFIGAKGIIRIDYMVTPDKIPVMLEVNTTPGMTATSFIPQQVQAAGLNMTKIMTDIIENK